MIDHKDSFLPENRYNNLFSIIEEIKPKSIIEIGTWVGVRAKQMIEIAKKHSKEQIYYVGFDLWKKPNKEEHCTKAPSNKKQVIKNISSTKCKYNLIEGNTRQTIPNFNPNITFDFIFIDGGHSLETIESDWISIQKFIHNTTVILFDDYYPNDLTKGCKLLIDNLDIVKWQCILLEPIDRFPNWNNFIVQMVRVQKQLV